MGIVCCRHVPVPAQVLPGRDRVLAVCVWLVQVWHMQPGTHFLTHSNMLHALKVRQHPPGLSRVRVLRTRGSTLAAIAPAQELDSSVEDLLFTAGEIDVREGLFQATRKGVYNR